MPKHERLKHEEVDMEQWTFSDPPHTGVYTTKQIMNGNAPITRVFHDSEDGAWQFHGPEPSMTEDAVLVCLHCVVELDAAIEELADLPLGWCAWRDDQSSAWQRAEREDTSEES